jgi:hypothetical protein
VIVSRSEELSHDPDPNPDMASSGSNMNSRLRGALNPGSTKTTEEAPLAASSAVKEILKSTLCLPFLSGIV